MDALKDFGLLGLAVLVAGLGVYFGSTGEEAYKGYDLMCFLLAACIFCAQLILRDVRLGTFGTAALAAGCNAYLLYRKFDGAGESACNINETMNCDIVNTSAASELFGFPVTLYGVAFYVGLGLAAIAGRERTPRFDQINGLFAVLSLGFSAYLGYHASQLGAFCVMCVTIYICNGLLLWAALRGLKQSGGSLLQGVDKVFGTSTFWLITAAFALITVVGASSWRGRDTTAAAFAPKPDPHGDHPHPHPHPQPSGPPGTFSAEQLANAYARPQGRIELDGTEPVLGRPGASIEVLEWADYACPHCAHASPMLKKLVSDHPEVNLRFKAFPLTGECNPVVERQGQPERCHAAMAAECAGEQGQYFELSSKIFANLGYNSPEDLAFMAKEVDIDFGRWEACMTNPATIQAVADDALAGARVNIQGTPAIFIRGLAGDDWVEVTGGPDAVPVLIESKLDGMELLPPS